jgi:hypothetical protein
MCPRTMSIIERMGELLTHRLFLLLFLPFLALPALAQKVATKDGTVIQLQKYRVTEQTLFYVNDAGTEVAIRMKDIDLDRTAHLNAHELTPLIFPGMPPPGDSLTTPPPLGDVARKLGSSEKNSPKER